MASRTEFVAIKATSNLGDVAAKDAAQVALLRGALGDLDGTNVNTARSTQTVTQQLDQQGSAFRRQTASIDQFSGRLRLLTEAAVIGGPALIAMGAAAVPAVTGLAAAFGFAALGAGTLVAGFQGVGTAFDALNKAQLEPTAANLAAARQAMEDLSPAARSIVGEIDRLGPSLLELRDASAQGISPQFTRGMDNLIAGLPRLSGLFEETAGAAASVLADGAGILTADRWQPFLRFVEEEAPDAILQLGRAAGDLSFGFAELFRSMGPINNDVLDFIEKAADGFADWSAGLEGSEGLRGFFAYLRETGPQVGEALAAMSNAVLEIAKAAAPLSGPVLGAITGISNAVAAVASSDLGAPFVAAVAGALALNRALKITSALAAAPAVGALLGTGTGAAGGAALASRAKFIPGATVAAAGIVGAKQIADLYNWITGAEKMRASAESLASSLQQGRVPAELDNIGASIDYLGTRDNVFEKIGDAGNRFLGTTTDQLKIADEQFKATDETLTLIAQQKGPEAASKAFQVLAENAGLSLEQMGELKAQLPGFSDAVGSRSMGDLLGLFENIPGAIDRATASANSFKAALQGAASALEGRSMRRDYEASLDAATAALKANGKTLDINTEKGRANAAALDGIAVSAINVAQGMKGASRVEFLKGARAQFIDMAQSMGKTAAQARNLADRLGLIKPVKAKVDIGGDAAKAALKAINAALDKDDGKNAKPKIDLVDGPIKSALKAINAALEKTDNKRAKPKVDLDDGPFKGKNRGVNSDLNKTDGKRARPTADLNDGPFRGRNAQVMAALNTTSRFTANPTANLIDRASGPAAAIRGAIAAIQSKTVTITVNRVMTGIANLMPGSAEGNMFPTVQAFAGGGMDRADAHQPEFAGPGPTRVWREPETGGESYIPWADDYRRPRAKAIAEQTVGLFGGQVQWFAEGGMNGRFGDAIKGFDVGKDSSLKDVRKELNEFERAVRKAGGTTTKQYAQMSDRLLRVSKSLDENRKELDKSKESLSNLRQAQDSMRESVTSGFRTAAFGEGVDDVPDWLSGDALAAVRGAAFRNGLITDAANATAFKGSLTDARGLGLSGGLLKAVAGSGDKDFAAYIASLGSQDIRGLEQLYSQRQSVSASAGRSAAAVYDPEVKATRQAVDRLAKEVRAITDKQKGIQVNASSVRAIGQAAGKGAGDAVNKGAGSGKRGSAK